MPGIIHQRLVYRIAAVLTAILSLSTSVLRGDESTEVEYPDAIADIAEWFAAWELVSKDVYGIERLRPVDFVFFDSEYVFSTSDIAVAGGRVIGGPRLLNQQFTWQVNEHEGSLKLPDGSTIPLGLMSFAAPIDDQHSGAFFVMPLPSFWEEAGVTSEELGLRNLLTGVFLHEFSHSQQMHNFGAQLTRFEESYQFDSELTDDIVQDYFENDDQYTSSFRDEVRIFYDAAHGNDDQERFALARKALTRYRARQQTYFVEDLGMLRELDDFFLSMEGLGQFSMYAWLVHPGGGALGEDLAEAGARRGGRWWSQEQGLSLFLLLQRFSDPKEWAGGMFGANYALVIDLIEAELPAE